jgi:hypothetical protein
MEKLNEWWNAFWDGVGRIISFGMLVFMLWLPCYGLTLAYPKTWAAMTDLPAWGRWLDDPLGIKPKHVGYFSLVDADEVPVEVRQSMTGEAETDALLARLDKRVLADDQEVDLERAAALIRWQDAVIRAMCAECDEAIVCVRYRAKAE